MGATDDGLVAGMAAGDPDAAAAFVRRYQSRVFGLALTIVGVPAVAEDVAQEAFVRAWRFAGGYDPATIRWQFECESTPSYDFSKNVRLE